MKLTPKQHDEVQALVDTADECRVAILEAHRNGKTPGEQLTIMSQFLKACYSMGAAHAKGKTLK